jgi:hypothetical protein
MTHSMPTLIRERRVTLDYRSSTTQFHSPNTDSGNVGATRPGGQATVPQLGAPSQTIFLHGRAAN